MKLNEITYVPRRTVDRYIGDQSKEKTFIQNVQWDEGKIIGNIRGDIPVYQYPTSENGLILYTLQYNDNIVSSLSLKMVDLPHVGKYYMTRRAWTDPKYRRKGYMLELINFLRSKGYKLVSDTETTPDGKELWKGISRHFNVSVFDIETGEKTPRENIPDKDIYKINPYNPENKHLLILEERSPLEKLNLDDTLLGRLPMFIKY